MIPGSICYAEPVPTVGREQRGARPVLVVSGAGYTEHIPDLVVAAPLTTRDRGLPHHVPVGGAGTGLTEPSWALCEQIRAVSVDRIVRVLGHVDEHTMRTARQIIRYLLDMV